jgi:hypothetical protein
MKAATHAVRRDKLANMGRGIAAVAPVISRADVSARTCIFVVGRRVDRRVYALEQMSGTVEAFRPHKWPAQEGQRRPGSKRRCYRPALPTDFIPQLDRDKGPVH